MFRSHYIKALAKTLSIAVMAVAVNFTLLAPAAQADLAGSGVCTQDYSITSGTGSVTVYSDGSYCYIAFKNSGALDTQTQFSWNAPDIFGAELLVVGGGGGAGNFSGGGAGEYVVRNNLNISSASIIVTVGAGGSPGGNAAPNAVASRNGQSSGFDAIVAAGGGGGSQYQAASATNVTGASAGGGPLNVTGGQSLDDGDPLSFGNNGGAGYYASSVPVGGGGGGAGAAGQNATNNSGNLSGAGGIGKAWPAITTHSATALGIGQVSGTAVYFAGGGGGYFGNSGTVVNFSGGLGGGANGAAWGSGDALAHTGGGGGGSNTYAGFGGDGGSGVVVVRYVAPQTLTLISGNSVTTQEVGFSTSPTPAIDPASADRPSGWATTLNGPIQFAADLSDFQMPAEATTLYGVFSDYSASLSAASSQAFYQLADGGTGDLSLTNDF
jgi:hypothetical protein